MKDVILAVGLPAGFATDQEWRHLSQELALGGWELSADLPTSPSKCISAMLVFNHQPDGKDISHDFGLDRVRRIRLVMEPRVTAPQCYARSEADFFGLSICTSAAWAQELQAEHVPWPQRLAETALARQNEKYDLLMFAGNKFSAIRGERYSLRRELIRLADVEGVQLAVAGSGWTAKASTRIGAIIRSGLRALQCGELPRLVTGSSAWHIRPLHSLGFVEDQASLYGSSRMSVVIENSADYVSEKVIDAIRAGSVPLYVGPSLEDFGLPSDIAVACPPDAREILDAFTGTTAGRLDAARRAAHAWLSSDEALAHSTEVVFRRIGRLIMDHLGQ